MNKLKIVVVGNCQARPISNLLEKSCNNLHIIQTVVAHLVSKNESKNILQYFHETDFIVSQYISDDYKVDSLTTNFLRSSFSNKLILIPNLYFKGYTPDLTYLRLKSGTLSGPLGDYHSLIIYESWKSGKSIAEACASYLADEIWEEKYKYTASESLLELRKREKELHIEITDVIASYLRDKRLFYTFNHPSLFLLKKLVEKILILINCNDKNNLNIERIKEPLDQFVVPVNKFSVSQLKINNIALNHQYFQATIEMQRIRYELEEIVTAFFTHYDSKRLVLKDKLRDF